jgi:hypothetical protein
MENNNSRYEDHEERLRAAKMFGLVRSATVSDMTINLKPEISRTEEKIMRTALELEGVRGGRVIDFLSDFERMSSRGVKLDDLQDGSFLVQASRFYALLDYAFREFGCYVTGDRSIKLSPEQRLRYGKFMGRLHGDLYHIVGHVGIDATVELGEDGMLMSPEEIQQFNEANSFKGKLAYWPGIHCEIDPNKVAKNGYVEDFIESRAITIVDSMDQAILNKYKENGSGLTRNNTFEWGVLREILKAVFLYQHDDARTAVYEGVTKYKFATEEAAEELDNLVEDTGHSITALNSEMLNARANQIYRLAVELANAPEGEKSEAKHVTMDALRNFAKGLPEVCINRVVHNAELLTQHPVLLNAYLATVDYGPEAQQ